MASASPSVSHMSPQALCQQQPRPPLIDVRSRLEYRGFHAPQAVNLSLPRLLLGQLPGLGWMLPQWFHHLPRHAPVAVICLTSHRSPIAAQQLTKAGFRQVINVDGGMMAWRQAELPVVSGAEEPQSAT